MISNVSNTVQNQYCSIQEKAEDLEKKKKELKEHLISIPVEHTSSAQSADKFAMHSFDKTASLLKV